MVATIEEVQARMKKLGITRFSSRSPFTPDERMEQMDQIEEIKRSRAEECRDHVGSEGVAEDSRG
jgi:hypothetical protein